MNKPITYLSGGFLGDFIYQLSIVNENYLLAGRKGNVFLSDKSQVDWSEGWKYGIEKAYNDLKEIVLDQEYINSFNIYNKEWFFEYTHLSKWRQSSLLLKTDMYELFKSTYNVEWGWHKWLSLPKINDYSDIILLSTVASHRCNPLFDYESLKRYNKQICFATTDYAEYVYFKELTKSKFEAIIFDNLKDYWIAINSCYLFVSSFGSFLCAANAMHQNTLAIIPYAECSILLPKDFINLKWFKNYTEHNLPEILR